MSKKLYLSTDNFVPFPAEVTHAAAGNGDLIAYDAATDSFTLTIATGPNPFETTVSPEDLVESPTPRATIYSNGTVSLIFLTPGEEGDGLNYVTFGRWSRSLGKEESGRIVFGIRTPEASVPSTGSASFDGTVSGSLIFEGRQNGVIGSFFMSANFAAGTLTGEFASMEKSRGTELPTTPWRDFSVNANISGGDFAGTITSVDDELTGPLSGSFFGPAAEEIGGTWAVGNSDEQAIGVFVGKRK